jgi:hypothetical protein
MPKFVLIDHSITEVGGHYYEYAVRVLRAAEEAGFEPILATNRKLRGIGRLPWRIVPAYRYDFFQPDPARLLLPLRQVLGAWRRRAARLKYRVLFSRLGVLWSKWRQRGAAPIAISRRLLLVAMVLGSVARAARQFTAAVASPWRALLGHGSSALQQAYFSHKRNAFATDSLRLFRQVALHEGDVVLLPTVSEADMLGLLTLFAANRETDQARWHLIFRRNIYQGRDPDYAGQDESLRPLRNAFRQFQAQLCGQQVFFHTDTEPLSVQYNRLGVASFRTASIPVAPDYSSFDMNSSSDTPWRRERSPSGDHDSRHGVSGLPSDRSAHVIYIGDARTEKGYHWLPHLVGDAFAADLPVRFTFQSNFNVPAGEPAAVVARAQLEAMPPECRVELIKRPLSSYDYRRLLQDSDIVVIPYDRDNYYARSSGIFAEALVAGKPVLVPAGTWMASELSAAIGEYHQSLSRRHPIVAAYQAHQLAWRTPGTVGFAQSSPDTPWREPRSPKGDRPLRHGVSELPSTYCWLKVPLGATHLLVSLKLDDPCRGIFPKIAAEYIGQGQTVVGRAGAVVGGAPDGRGSVLAGINPSARRVRIELSNAYSTVQISINDLRIEFFSSRESLPISAVGAVYAEPNELSGHLREVLAHYCHYRATATAFSCAWSAYHCPQTFLEQLVGGEPSANEGASSRQDKYEPPGYVSAGNALCGAA